MFESPNPSVVFCSMLGPMCMTLHRSSRKPTQANASWFELTDYLKNGCEVRGNLHCVTKYLVLSCSLIDINEWGYQAVVYIAGVTGDGIAIEDISTFSMDNK